MLFPPPKNNTLAIVGWHEGLAGQLHALLTQEGYTVDCFVNETCAPLDIRPIARQARQFSYPQEGTFKDLPFITDADWLSRLEERGVESIVIAVPDARWRQQTFDAAQGRMQIHAYRHDSAVVLPDAVMGTGCILLPRALLGYRAELGHAVLVNTGASIDHHSVVDDFATIQPGAVLCGNVHVGQGAVVGAGATVVQRVALGKGSLVGAGALVRKDVPENTVVVGNPALIHTTLSEK